MDRTVKAVTLFVLVVSMMSVVYPQSSELERMRRTAEELEWNPADAGVQVINIAGDNETPGMYVYRVRFPDGFRNEPHFHPDDRIVTVISGMLDMGYGSTFDPNGMRTLEAGSVWTEPAGQTHFVWAREGEAVIQVIGIGPSGTTPAAP